MSDDGLYILEGRKCGGRKVPWKAISVPHFHCKCFIDKWQMMGGLCVLKKRLYQSDDERSVLGSLIVGRHWVNVQVEIYLGMELRRHSRDEKV